MARLRGERELEGWMGRGRGRCSFVFILAFLFFSAAAKLGIKKKNEKSILGQN